MMPSEIPPPPEWRDCTATHARVISQGRPRATQVPGRRPRGAVTRLGVFSGVYGALVVRALTARGALARRW